MTAPAPASDANQVLVLIRQIVRKISEHSRQLSRDSGLTVPQMLCLKAVYELHEEHQASVTVARVAARVQLSAATTSRVLDRLVRSGWVERGRDTSDRRRVLLTLSAEGAARYEQLPTAMQETFVERFACLSGEEQSSLIVALERIVEMMDASDIDASPILTPESTFRNGD